MTGESDSKTTEATAAAAAAVAIGTTTTATSTTGSSDAPRRSLSDDVERVLFDADAIARRVKELGAQLSDEFADKNPLVVGLLAGASVFHADLIRNIDIMMQVDFIAASSYGNAAVSSGTVDVYHGLRTDPAGRHVILVEDVIDSGRTLNKIAQVLDEAHALSVTFVSLLDKKAGRQVTFDRRLIVGFDCPDEFVVGYGIDYAERYRNLPYVGALKRSVYTK